MQSDLELAAALREPAIALEQALLYLHETEVLDLDKGRTVFRSAMTIQLVPAMAPVDSRRRILPRSSTTTGTQPTDPRHR